MSFHVYLEPELELKIEILTKQTGRKRNSLVREALREYLEKHLQKAWPAAVFDFKPEPRLARFESLRSGLPPDREDIFQRRKK